MNLGSYLYANGVSSFSNDLYIYLGHDSLSNKIWPGCARNYKVRLFPNFAITL